MQLLAPAKINLSLEITGRRADAYHEVVSLMQTVSLADSLQFEANDDLRVRVVNAELPEDNLVMRAALALRRRFGVTKGCTITLEKRIPIAAGLGGGSSDAAAALLGLGKFWELDVETREFVALAAALGSDVPFFLAGGTALAEGRGERVTALPSPGPSWYLLANPGVPVLTSAVYASLIPDDFTDGERTRSLAAELDPFRAAPVGCNGLQPALFRISAEARECFAAVSEVAPLGAMISGSGPTVFAAFDSPEAAVRAAVAVRARGNWAAVECSIGPREGAG